MRVPRVRFRVRRMMILVVASALFIWAGIAAFRVSYETDNWLYHEMKSGPKSAAGDCHIAPSWPRYWRHLAGLPWPGSYDCSCDFWNRYKAGLSVTVMGSRPRKVRMGKGYAPMDPAKVRQAIYRKFTALSVASEAPEPK